jgi:hypothetical protein
MKERDLVIIDNDFVSKEVQDALFGVVTDRQTSWFLNYQSVPPDTSGPEFVVTDKTKEVIQFNHLLNVSGEPVSPLYDVVMNAIFYPFIEKHSIVVNKILRAKLNLVPSFKEDVYQTPHVDQNTEHKVFLYYINDSDGETIFFNEFFNNEKYKELTEMVRVMPQMGKGVVFDGFQFHAPTAPKDSSFRIVLNVDFI